jgi:mitochondrial GTPase 1
VGIPMIADYMLFVLNRARNFTYVSRLNLVEPTDDIRFLLQHTARLRNLLKPDGSTNDPLAAQWLLAAFRRGAFGRVMLDALPTV